MKIAELLEKLKGCDPETEVLLEVGGVSGDCCSVEFYVSVGSDKCSEVYLSDDSE